MQDITTVGLDVRHFEIACTVDDDISGIILLTSSFRIETRTIKQDAKVGTIKNASSRSKKLAIVINALYFCDYISKLYRVQLNI